MLKKIFIIMLLLYYQNIFADLYSDAENYYTQKNFKNAIKLYKKTLASDQSNDKYPYVLYKIAKSYIYLKDFSKAISYLKESINTEYSFSKKDSAIYLLARLNYFTKNKKNAKYWKQLLKEEYPNSIYNRTTFWKWYRDDNIPVKDSSSYLKKNNNSNYKDISLDDSVEEPILNQNINKINTILKDIFIDFKEAKITKIIKAFSDITGIQYKLNFSSTKDYISFTADDKVEVSLLPVLLENFLRDFDYEIEKTSNYVKINKSVSPFSGKSRKNKYYYLYRIKTENKSKMLKSVKNLSMTFFPVREIENSDYILITCDTKKDLEDFMQIVKRVDIQKENYLTKKYKLKKARCELLQKKILEVKNGEYVVTQVKGMHSPQLEKINSLFTSENVIKTLKSVKDVFINRSENTIIFVMPEQVVSKIDVLIDEVDVELFKKYSDIRIFNLQYAKANDVVEHIKYLFADYLQTLPDNLKGIKNETLQIQRIYKIIPDERTNSVLLVADNSIIKQIEELIRKLDVNVYQQSTKLKIYYLENSKCNDVAAHIQTIFNTSIKNNNKDYKLLKGLNKIIPDKRTNSIVVVGSDQVFPYIEKLLKVLDINVKKEKNEKTFVKTYNTYYRKPSFISKKLDSIFKDILSKSYSYKKIYLKFNPMDSENLLLVISNNPQVFSRVELWIKKIDKKPKKTYNEIVESIHSYVYTCRNIAPTDMASMLNNMIASIKKFSENRKKINLNNKTEMVNYIKDLSPDIFIAADQTSNSIIINASKKDYSSLIKIIKKIDKIPEQVSVNVLLVEVSLNDGEQFGIEWSLGDNNSRFGTNMGMRATERGTGLDNPYLYKGLRFSVLDGNKFNLLMQNLKTKNKLNILSNPRITTAHNKKAVIKLGKEVPIQKISQQTYNLENNNNLTDQPYITQYTEFKDVGITLDVTPKVSANNMVTMNLHLLVSDIDPTSQTQFDNPIINKREMNTFRSVLSGNTIVIGGLIKKDESIVNTKVPFFNKLPIIGKSLFTRTEKSKTKTELMIFITPRIIK